jgi:hypothetical protein
MRMSLWHRKLLPGFAMCGVWISLPLHRQLGLSRPAVLRCVRLLHRQAIGGPVEQAVEAIAFGRQTS